jgi:hypothetical protein
MPSSRSSASFQHFPSHGKKPRHSLILRSRVGGRGVITGVELVPRAEFNEDDSTACADRGHVRRRNSTCSTELSRPGVVLDLLVGISGQACMIRHHYAREKRTLKVKSGERGRVR